MDANRANGMSEIEGKGVMGSAEGARESNRVSMDAKVEDSENHGLHGCHG